MKLQHRDSSSTAFGMFSLSTIIWLAIIVACLPGWSARASNKLFPSGYIFEKFWGTCGKTHVNDVRTPLIVGGRDVKPGEFPFFAQLIELEPHSVPGRFCSATIISDYHILTAAHCFKPRSDLKNFRVVVGTSKNVGYLIKKHHKMPNVPTHNVSDVCLHPAGPGYDTAIITLDSPLEFDDYVQPACYHTGLNEGDINIGSRCFEVGAGLADVDARKYRDDPFVKKFRVKRSMCLSEKFDNYDKGTYFCYKNYKEDYRNATSCNGDSGGPIMCLDTSFDKWYVIGVAASVNVEAGEYDGVCRPSGEVLIAAIPDMDLIEECVG